METVARDVAMMRSGNSALAIGRPADRRAAAMVAEGLRGVRLSKGRIRPSQVFFGDRNAVHKASTSRRGLAVSPRSRGRSAAPPPYRGQVDVSPSWADKPVFEPLAPRPGATARRLTFRVSRMTMRQAWSKWAVTQLAYSGCEGRDNATQKARTRARNRRGKESGMASLRRRQWRSISRASLPMDRPAQPHGCEVAASRHQSRFRMVKLAKIAS